MRGSAMTWRQLLAQRHAAPFIGREREQELFRLNFLYQIPAYLIFALHGPAGAGKSTLIARYRAIAEEHDAVTVRVDATQAAAVRDRTIMATMLDMARQFSAAGTPLTAFEERYATYQTCRQMIAEDFGAPDGVFGILHNANEADTVQAEVWSKYLFERFGNRTKIALVKDPVATLTQTFVSDINAWATVRTILLCFDDWEHTGPHLESWLPGLLTQHEMRTDIWLVIASESPLGEAWEAFRRVTVSLAVQPFTEDETHAYLTAHNVSDPARVTDVVTFSGGLPLLVSLLAGATGGSPADLALTPVDRYLKWLDDARQRDAVLQCAAARYLNADVAAALVGEADAAALLAWLEHMPGLMKGPDAWCYHAEIRRRLLAFAQQQSPGLVQTAHTRLLAYYRNRSAGVPRFEDAGWRRDWLEALYHGLMIANGPTIQQGIAIFFAALRSDYALSGDVVRTWQQAADAQLTRNDVIMWSHLLQGLWAALEDRDWDEVLALCEAVVGRDDLSEEARREAEAFLQIVGARLHPISPEPEAVEPPAETATLPEPAVAEHEMAVEAEAAKPPELAPSEARLTESATPEAEPAGEAEAVLRVEEEEAASPEATPPEPPTEQPTIPIEMAGVAEAEIDVEAADYVHRADAYLRLGEYKNAIADYGKAIALDPNFEKAYYNRGLAYAQQQQYPEAVADLTQAIALDPEHATAYYNRGLVHARQNDLVQAIADYDQAIAQAPAEAAFYNSRANAYYKIGDHQRAIADYDQAIKRDPAYADAYLNRGLAYATIEEYRQAIADYNQAIALNPESAIAYNYRGLAYARLQQVARALEDYDRALLLNPQFATAHNNRGLCFVRLGNYELALAEYQKAIDVDPQYATAHYNAACAAALNHNAAVACAWLEKAIRLAPRYQAMARRDSDFDAIREDTTFQTLTAGETAGG